MAENQETYEGDDEVIAVIKWTVADVRKAFVDKYGRQPSKGQLRDCVENVETKRLEEAAITQGWEYINEAII